LEIWKKLLIFALKLIHMTKKKIMKNIKTPNKFEEGGYFDKVADNAGVASLATGAGSMLSGNFTTDNNIGEWMQAAGAAASFIPGPVGMTLGAVLGLAGGLTERAFGTEWNQEGLAKAENNLNSLKGFNSGATSYDALMSDIANINNMNTKVEASDLGKDGWWSNKTQDKANKLNKETAAAYNTAMRNISNTADNIATDTLANLERNYAALGGPLFAYGGHTHGADFTNGLMFVNNGGSHESNPYEGVPVSMDPEGNPNLVEEGEVIWNDYVFSNRLKVPKAVRSKYKLRGPKDMTFAKAVENISKESNERPNDPISKRGLDNNLMLLAMEQEKLRPKNTGGNKFNTGGPKVTIYPAKKLNIPEFVYALPSDTNINTSHIEEAMKKADVEADLELGLLGEGIGSQSAPLKTGLRYAPAIGHGLLTITDLLELTNKADYTNANAVIDASKKAATYNPVSFKTISDYMTYNPFDTEYHANQLRAQTGATRRNIMNTSGGNRATAMSGLLSADYNVNNSLGDLYRKANEYNLEQRQKVADFNRTTNITNSEGIFRADAANQAARQAGLQALISGYTMKEQAKLMSDQAKAANISGLIQGLGDIGYENFGMNQVNWRTIKGVDGPGTETYLDDITGRTKRQERRQERRQARRAGKQD
jgi:hypothetical protein